MIAIKYDNNFKGLPNKDTEFVTCENRLDTAVAATAAHASFLSNEYYEKINLFLIYL
jgi:hypothetical protein